MSFVDQEDIIAMGEDMLRKVVKDVKGIDVSGPFPRMTYAEAMDRFVQINLTLVSVWNLSMCHSLVKK